MANSSNRIQILQNKNVIETIMEFSNYSHLTCVDKFNIQNDIFELRSQGLGKVSEFLFSKFFIIMEILNSNHKATISLKIINKGIPTQFKFGKNRTLRFITISSINSTCDENFETARTVLIKNEKIIESECEEKKRFIVLHTMPSEHGRIISKMILLPGKYISLFKKLKFKTIV